MATNPEVDAWFEKLEHPQKPGMLAVRAAILAADARMTESIKWSTPTFEFGRNLASIQPNAKRFVSLLFHRGAEIPGDHPLLVGEGRLARTMQFANPADVEAKRTALAAVVRAWCDWRAKA